jgi:uroporphyrin-III C-methyltransferase
MTRPGRVWLIGAGPGDPELLTVRAARALGQADVVVIDHLVSRAVLDHHARPYVEVIDAGKQGGKPCIAQEQINRILVSRARAGQAVARLKGGDPFVFGRGAEEAEALIEAGIEWEVIPGVSSGIAAPAYAGIPLLHRDHASSVAFISGHAGRAADALDCTAETLVIFMCASTIVQLARELIGRGRPARTKVALIRNGTLPTQSVRVGTLEELAACPEAFDSPLIAVVGEVAGLAGGLHWFGAAPQPLTPPLRRLG